MATIRVYPYLSPRILEIVAPTTNVSVQELVDLVRAWNEEKRNTAKNGVKIEVK